MKQRRSKISGHPYIVHGLESDETIHYWVMENAPKRRLCDAYPQGTRLSLGKVVAMVNDLTDALLYLHYDKKMKHLNITPKTVLLGPYDLPVLSGFKLAQEVILHQVQRGVPRNTRLLRCTQ